MKHFFTIIYIFFLSQFISQNENNGYLYEGIFDIYKMMKNNITEKAVFDGNEVKKIMDKFCEIINENSKVEKVLYNELSKVKNGSTFAQGANSSPNATSYVFDFFPTGENLKSALKKNYAEYYDVKLVMGGIIFSSDLAEDYISYQAIVNVSAKGPDKKTIWSKKGIYADFSSVFEDGSLTKNKKRFKVMNKQTLTLEEIEKSAVIALKGIIGS